jgi:osmoprotectant transport system substrate-binding protein
MSPVQQEKTFMNRTRLVMATALVTSALALAACGDGGDPLAAPSESAAPTDTIVVGSADFAENSLLAEIYAGALSAKGVKVTKKLNIGSRETYIPGLEDGSIDLIPEYSGVLMQYFDKDATATSPDDVFTALKTAVPTQLTVLEKAAAEDKDSITVTKETADKYSLKSIADLKPVAKDLVLGGPPEWKTRPTGAPGLKKVYGLEFKSFKALDAGGPLTINALKKGTVQAADVFSTDPNIPANNWVVLDDPSSLFAAQNIVPLINKAKASATVTDALNAVSAKLDTPTLAELVKKVVLDKEDPETVAKEFLTTNSLS